MQGPSSLPVSPSAPFPPSPCHSGAGSRNFPLDGGCRKGSPRTLAVLPSLHPGLWMELPALLLPHWRWINGVGRGMGCLHSLSIPSVPFSCISQNCLRVLPPWGKCGSAPSEAATAKAALAGGCKMPRRWKEQEHVSRESFHLLVTVTSAKNSLVFVTSSSLQCLCGAQAE